VSSRGRALVDRELYLPEKSWCEDRARCEQAGIGEDVGFATKPELAQRMLERARDAGALFGWFTADEAYGDNPGLRAYLEDQDINYVMAISCDQRLSTPTGRVRADELARMAPTRGWQRLSAGEGSKGQRLYDCSSSTPETISTSSSSAARSANQVNWPTTSSTAAPRSPWSNWSESPDPAGAWKKPSSSPKRDRPGPLPGPQIPGLVPAHHPVHARRGIPRRHRPR
jgi:SRSO17 transposase